MGKSIGILSIKGGVGKTSSVVALGDAISGFGKRVLLVDANFSAPNLGMHLKIVDPEKSLHDVLSRKANLRESIQRYEISENSLNPLKSKISYGFDVLPSDLFNRSVINPLELKNKIRYVKDSYDIILIDSSPALNDETLAAILASDEIIIVTTPDYATLSVTLKAVKLAKQRRTPIIGLILNKVHNKNFELSLDDIEKTVNVPVLAVIPHDVDMLKATANFVPSTTHKPNSKSSTEYKKLAGVLVGEKHKPLNFRDFFNPLPKRHEINREIFYESLFG